MSRLTSEERRELLGNWKVSQQIRKKKKSVLCCLRSQPPPRAAAYTAAVLKCIPINILFFYFTLLWVFKYRFLDCKMLLNKPGVFLGGGCSKATGSNCSMFIVFKGTCRVRMQGRFVAFPEGPLANRSDFLARNLSPSPKDDQSNTVHATKHNHISHLRLHQDESVSSLRQT